ncbi:hypothetical protein, partial [Klebsiella quasipneumoniae]|uniref:hypothetical protein n=1 Tax=Klebsiella quasipneumoniae TaxID=1463165 RepID=UPI001C65DFA7
LSAIKPTNIELTNITIDTFSKIIDLISSNTNKASTNWLYSILYEQFMVLHPTQQGDSASIPNLTIQVTQ